MQEPSNKARTRWRQAKYPFLRAFSLYHPQLSIHLAWRLAFYGITVCKFVTFSLIPGLQSANLFALVNLIKSAEGSAANRILQDSWLDDKFPHAEKKPIYSVFVSPPLGTTA